MDQESFSLHGGPGGMNIMSRRIVRYESIKVRIYMAI